MSSSKISDLANATDLDSAIIPIVQSSTNKRASIDLFDDRVTALGDARYQSTILLNVKDYGAVGDGVTDDSAAINAAFAYLRVQQSLSYPVTIGYTLFFPAGSYRVNSSINATGLSNFINWNICGTGKIFGYCTGKAVFDFTDSRWYNIENIAVYGDSTNKPSCAFLLARGTTIGYCDVTLWQNVSTDGYFSKAAIHNYASEDTMFIKCLIQNKDTSATSYCLAQDGDNSLGATSDYKTVLTTGQSFNNNTFIGCEFRKSVGGPSIFIRRCDGHYFRNCYGVSVNDAVVVISTATSVTTSDIYLGIHCETSGATSCVRFDGLATQVINSFGFKDHAPQANTAIFQTGTGVNSVSLYNVDIDIPAFQVTPSVGVFNTASKFHVYGGKIYIGSAASLHAIGHMNAYVIVDDRTVTSWSTGNQIIQDRTQNSLAIVGTVGINQLSPTTSLEVLVQDNRNNSNSSAMRLTKLTTGTPAIGIGGGWETIVQTDTATYKLASVMGTTATDVTTGSEDFDFIFYLMKAGAAATEAFRIKSTGTVKYQSFVVASLPSGSAGEVTFASNGRKNGEGAGVGTGVLVFHDGTAWRACDTGATVAA